MRKLLFIPVLLIAGGIIAGCENEKHSYVANVTDPAHTPTMVTENVSTLISDSGYTRYHIVAPVWNMYDESEEPYWTFPEGLELEQYDLQMRPAANMECDSATYFSNKRLWRLDGNVVMVNTLADSFLTQQLFWDQAESKVYSDSFIHIVRQKHIIEGYGFVSNQEMTEYTVNRPTAIIPVDNEPGSGNKAAPAPGADTVSALDRGERPMAPEPASRRGLIPAPEPDADQAPRGTEKLKKVN